MEEHKYLRNFLEMPWLMIVFIIGVTGVLTGIASGLFSRSIKGIWYAGAGTVLTVLALFMLVGFNQTSFYPSVVDLQSSLTIESASSSKFTLTVMSYVSLIVPFVIGYIWYVWKSMNKKKMDRNELELEDHLY
jgi:cytochrome d ubiquinol oxidase subunit II